MGLLHFQHPADDVLARHDVLLGTSDDAFAKALSASASRSSFVVQGDAAQRPSIHPLEALVASVIPYTLILFLVPKHPTAYLIFVWTDAAIAVVTHLGYETFPRGFARHRVGRWIGTATAHEAHHTKPGCNFGLYFLFWDRLMGTLDPEYEANFDKATATEPRAKDEKDDTVLTA